MRGGRLLRAAEQLDALSANYSNRITIREGSCYIGQPYSGYAAKRESEEECIIIGVLIRKETFIR